MEVMFPVPAGEDPAYWIPDEATLLKYQQADLILINGANYAQWLKMTSMPINRLVNTSKHVKEHYIYSDEVLMHTHGPAGDHSHNNLLANVWLDMTMAKEQAVSITSAFIKLLPDQEQRFQQNLQLLLDDLNELDLALAGLGKSFAGNPVLASHPVYQYLSRRYLPNMQSLHWEPDKMPELSEWQNMEILLQQHPATWMLWEAQPTDEIIARLAQLGLRSIVFYPLERRPAHGDFLSVMRDNIGRLSAIVEK